MHCPAQAPTDTLNQSQPRLRGELRFVPQRDRRGEPWFRVEHDQRASFYRLGMGEYELLARLDGRTSVDAARAAAAAAAPAWALSGAQAESLVLWAHQQGLLDGETAALQPVASGRRNSLLWIRLPLGRGGAGLDPWARAFGWLFTPAAALAATALGLMAVLTVFSQWQRFARDASALLSVEGSVALLIAWGVLKGVHEAGHAISCRKFGGRVGEFGVAWMLVAPVAYVDLSDVYRIRSRWQRAATAAAGVYLELVVASLAVIAWSQSDAPLASHLLTSMALMASVSTIVFNLNPLMRLDGYFVLTDLLGRPNLAGDAAAAVAAACRWLFLGDAFSSQRGSAGGAARRVDPATGARNATAGADRRIAAWGLLMFGLAAAAYRLAVLAGLLLAAVAIYGLPGFAAGAAAVALLAAKPLGRILCAVIAAVVARPAVALRLTAAAGLLAVAVLAGQRLARSGADAWPGVIEFADVAPVRSEVAGFVTAIQVRDGQQVAAGDPLLTLENPALVARCIDAAAALASAELQDRLYRQQHDMAATGAQQQEIEALRARCEQLQRERSALCVIAPRGGTVVAPQLGDWQGRWLAAGDAVCHVVDARQMKVVCGVPASGLARLAQSPAGHVQVRRGSDWWQGQITTAPGHTSTTPPHPALAADWGGPLPTRPTIAGSPPVLLQPHARVEIDLRLTAVSVSGRGIATVAGPSGPRPPLRAGEPVLVYPQ